MLRHSLAATLVSAFLLATPASAGVKQDVPVFVDVNFNYATGALGQTFGTRDRIRETIGCYIYYWLEDSVYAVCEAVTPAGVRGSCITSDPNHLQAIRSLNGDSILTFTWTVFSATRRDCSAIRVQSSSSTHPKR